MVNLNVDNLTIKENVIDRIVRFIDPVKAQQRFRARAMLALSGSYIGASRSKRSLSQWRTSWGDADSTPLSNCMKLSWKAGISRRFSSARCYCALGFFPE